MSSHSPTDESMSSRAAHCITPLIAAAARTAGIDADYSRALLDETCTNLGAAGSAADHALLLLDASIAAFRHDDSDGRSTTRRSRCWCQWFNRVAEVVGASLWSEPERLSTLLSRVSSALGTISAGSESDRIYLLDIKASIAAAVTWQMIANVGTREAVHISDPTFEELLMLYEFRYHFAAQEITQHLSGHQDRSTNPIKASFAFFSDAVTGQIDHAVSELGKIERTESNLPLSAAKLIVYSLSTMPVQVLRGTSDSDGLLLKVFRSALAVWWAHGADENYFRAAAVLEAAVGHEEGLTEAINAAVRLLSTRSGTVAEQFVDLVQLRGQLLGTLRVAEQLSAVEEVRGRAEAALHEAKQASNQTPTVVALFASVIALVIGSSQVAQGMPAQDRLLIVAGLGTVLLVFVLMVSGLARFNSDSGMSLRTLASFATVVIVGAAIVLSFLYIVAR